MFDVENPKGPWGLLTLISLGILALGVACAHLLNPIPACRDAAAADLESTSRRGFVFVGGSAAMFMGTDIVVSAGMFASKDGRSELHLLAPADVADLLTAHGFVRTGTECKTSDDKKFEIITKAFDAPALEGKPA